MKTKFNLSEKRYDYDFNREGEWDIVEEGKEYYLEEDVKEFIRRLKEAGEENDWDILLEQGEIGDITISFNEWIDKLAGDKLK